MAIKFSKVELKGYPLLESIKEGLHVIALKDSDYRGLKGVITEIKYGSEKETENDTVLDIYVDFDEPELSSVQYSHPHLNGTSIKQVIMGEDELGFLLDEVDPFFTTAEGKAVCPNCYEPLERVTETQYDDITWDWDLVDKKYRKETGMGDTNGKRCDKCNGEIDDDNGIVFSY